MIVNTILSDKVKTRRPFQFVPISREKTIKRVANYYEGHRPGSRYSAIVAFIMWMDRGGIVDEEGGNFS